MSITTTSYIKENRITLQTISLVFKLFHKIQTNVFETVLITEINSRTIPTLPQSVILVLMNVIHDCIPIGSPICYTNYVPISPVPES